MAMMAFTAPGPNTAVIKIASSSEGNANTKSLPRMMISSSAPPSAAAMSPSGTPNTKPMTTDSSATPTVFFAPAMIMDSTSRPELIGAEPVMRARGLQPIDDRERAGVVRRPDGAISATPMKATEMPSPTRNAILPASGSFMGDLASASRGLTSS